MRGRPVIIKAGLKTNTLTVISDQYLNDNYSKAVKVRCLCCNNEFELTTKAIGKALYTPGSRLCKYCKWDGQ